MASESLTKSIVYGNNYKNDYGTFLPVCSAVGQRLHCDKILEYLRSNKFFVRYQRYAYAYRVEYAPVVFITEKKTEESKFVEGCHSDVTIEGSGEKLLHLLEKLSKKQPIADIRNVFVAVLIDQKDPLRRFESSNYRAIVENCRELLNTLYTKVIKAELKLAKKQPNLIIDSEKTLVLKKCQVDRYVELPEQDKPVGYTRPNHIYSEGKPAFLQKTNSKLSRTVSSNHVEVKFLKGRSRTFEEQFQRLQTSLYEKDLEHLKFMATYDRNPLVLQVFQMVAFVEDLSHQQLVGFDFQRIASWKLQPLEPKRLRKLTDLLISNHLLIVDNIMKVNKSLAVVFSLMDLLIRNTKALQRIESLSRTHPPYQSGD